MGNLISTSAGLFKRRVASIYDTDAQNFFTAVEAAGGFFTLTEKNAVNQLVLNFKANGTWTKKNIIYPMVGGSAISQSFNLKNPATHRLTYSGGIVHSATGMKFNGTSGFADTGAAPSTFFTTSSGHFSLYSRTAGNAPPGGGYDMGASNTSGGGVGITAILCKFSDGKAYASMGSSAGAVNTPVPSGGGWYVCTQSGPTTILYVDGANASQANQSNTQATFPLFIGASNGGGTAELFSNREAAYADIGVLHSPSEIAADFTAIDAFQVTLSRQFVAGGGYHADTQAAIDWLSGIGESLTTAEKNGLDRLVRDLHGETNPSYATSDLWAKFVGLYPFVGATAGSHSLNLKTPGTFTLTYIGGVTHSSTGARSNLGSIPTGITDIPANLGATDKHMSVSQALDIAAAGYQLMIGDQNAGTSKNSMYYNTGAVILRLTSDYQSVATKSTAQGFWFASRINDSQIVYGFDGVYNNVGQLLNIQSGNTIGFSIGTGQGVDTDLEFDFGSVGFYISAAEAVNLNAAVVAYNLAVRPLAADFAATIAFLATLGIVLTNAQKQALNRLLLSLGGAPAPPAAAPGMLMEMAADQTITLPYEVVEYLRSEGFEL